ncbi:hypothetical protein [Amycolatopsis sp. DG1A-15b]|uniref:hypothetical protein n=1 Tax=Amycolatopsis sp. DG1A-15b TaxID=3052846 RepID=UPI00255B5F10|nr:hypothetical protein [Amycolatopsis sp. DG1A-15b]WIX89057.1 hypothetical protein QRY02_00980 [Amycolatopsis sp. DG1A-15b]
MNPMSTSGRWWYGTDDFFTPMLIAWPSPMNWTCVLNGVLNGSHRVSASLDSLSTALRVLLGEDSENSCDRSASAECTTASGCSNPAEEYGSRPSLADWEADPAWSPASHVVALVDAPALKISADLDKWAAEVVTGTHRPAGATVDESFFHLVSPWILLLQRLLILSWRTGAASASRSGLARIRRRSRELSPVGEVSMRPRCAGCAPRGPSAPRMSSMVIRGGALP